MRLRDVPHQYARCRAWGHAWDFTTVSRASGEYIQGMRCVACGTERFVRINGRTGTREHGNRYSYPEDLSHEAIPYKLPHGSGGALTADERGAVTLEEIKSRYTGKR
jgi:hypothetical protein